MKRYFNPLKKYCKPIIHIILSAVLPCVKNYADLHIFSGKIIICRLSPFKSKTPRFSPHMYKTVR